MPELMLLRHAKSDWKVPVDDYHRPLKNRGKRAAQRMGQYLLDKQLLPDCVISSSATRAISTAEKIVKAMAQAASMIEQSRDLYMADVETHLSEIKRCVSKHSDCERLLLVGHNPGLEELLDFLVEPAPAAREDGKLITTATLARIKLPNFYSLAEASGELIELVRPADLEPGFTYPSDSIAGEDEEKRIRPAYYYKQSGVIPYRLREGVPQVLLVRSSGNRHWVFPKGIVEPGLSAHDSACKEAKEEAGVSGQLHPDWQSDYDYEKWQAQCHVQMFALKVDEAASEALDQNAREPRLVTIQQACELLTRPALIKILRDFAALPEWQRHTAQ